MNVETGAPARIKAGLTAVVPRYARTRHHLCATLDTVLVKARCWLCRAGAALNEGQVKLLDRLLDGFEGKFTRSKWAAITQCSPDTALHDITQSLELEGTEEIF